ncbi:hypothetical protein M434DRAFT_32393 [Hypoxylon sp. CO27-5]|nr:hypothetical protein M434DRAFT_32393 [Hypoxylon sp. CO27-5]
MGVALLWTFATSNSFRGSIAGLIEFDEESLGLFIAGVRRGNNRVVLSEMEKAEFIFHKDTELDLRACGIGAYRMPKDSRTLIRDLFEEDQWEENGKAATMIAPTSLVILGTHEHL